MEATWDSLVTMFYMTWIGKTGLQNDKAMTNGYTYWGKLYLGVQRMSGLCLTPNSAFLCDAFILRQVLSMKQE